MVTYLDKILATHRQRAEADCRSVERLIDRALETDQPRGLGAAIGHADGLAVIAEIKRRSPSKGDLNPGIDPAVWATQYGQGGAVGISVLTDQEYFGGSPHDLAQVRQSVDLPILRKDFTVSLQDVCDARIMGADAVLLIVAALDEGELRDFHTLGSELGLDVLVETHDEAEVERALGVGASMIGVNQRDLVTFEVDQTRAIRVGRELPSDVVRVAESGVSGVESARALAQAGYDAILVGESIVTSGDPVAAISALRWSATKDPNSGSVP